jgi:hypothetical protein
MSRSTIEAHPDRGRIEFDFRTFICSPLLPCTQLVERFEHQTDLLSVFGFRVRVLKASARRESGSRSCNEVPGGGKLDEGTFNIAESSSSTSSLEKLTANVN